jgi:hypothetical protein
MVLCVELTMHMIIFNTGTCTKPMISSHVPTARRYLRPTDAAPRSDHMIFSDAFEQQRDPCELRGYLWGVRMQYMKSYIQGALSIIMYCITPSADRFDTAPKVASDSTGRTTRPGASIMRRTAPVQWYN